MLVYMTDVHVYTHVHVQLSQVLCCVTLSLFPSECLEYSCACTCTCTLVHVHVYRVLIRCTCMMYSDLCFQLKLRNMVTMQQEKLLGEREAALEKQRQEIESLRSSLTQKDEEVYTVQVTLYVHMHTYMYIHVHVMLS